MPAVAVRPTKDVLFPMEVPRVGNAPTKEKFKVAVIGRHDSPCYLLFIHLLGNFFSNVGKIIELTFDKSDFSILEKTSRLKLVIVMEPLDTDGVMGALDELKSSLGEINAREGVHILWLCLDKDSRVIERLPSFFDVIIEDGHAQYFCKKVMVYINNLFL